VVRLRQFSTGRETFLTKARESANFRLVRGDVLDSTTLTESMHGSSLCFIWRRTPTFALVPSNPAEISSKTPSPLIRVLTAMRQNGISKIAFSSSGSCTENRRNTNPEDARFPVQTSFYGASKRPAKVCSALTAQVTVSVFHFSVCMILGERTRMDISLISTSN